MIIQNFGLWFPFEFLIYLKRLELQLICWHTPSRIFFKMGFNGKMAYKCRAVVYKRKKQQKTPKINENGKEKKEPKVQQIKLHYSILNWHHNHKLGRGPSNEFFPLT